ncbi:MAG: hypothetical protein EOO27_32335 [Comamonadaceae bacterium]|nr:MAG: hypothetical protein EOO27_32335 [Comamonadaceae bacterium]
MAWGPIAHRPDNIANTSLLYGLIALFSNITSSQFTQKFLLVSLFVSAGVGAHKIVSKLRLGLVNTNTYAAYLAGIIYTINPFIYTRFLAGQWLVMLGYALLPWAILSIWNLINTPTLKNSLKVAVWASAISLTSIHTIGIVAVAGVVLIAVAKRENIKKRLIYFGAASLGWLTINLIWLIPFFTRTSEGASRIAEFGTSQFTAFATSGSILGSVPLSTLLLQGFWADEQGRYILPSSTGLWFAFFSAILGAIIVYGAVRVIRSRDRLGIGLIIMGLIGWFLAMGVGFAGSAGLTYWLFEHVPLYRGYRDTQKWLMLLVVAYSYLAAIGLAGLMERLKKYEIRRQLVLGFVLLLPLLITPMLLNGAAGQLRSAPYPEDYKQAAATLNKEGDDYKVVVFPWHMYLPLSYAGRVVANPAGHYFSQEMIISDNPELKGVPPEQKTDIHKLISNKLLPQRFERTDIAVRLKEYDVRYIMVLKEADWKKYSWLNAQEDLTLIQDTNTIQLYRIENRNK